MTTEHDPRTRIVLSWLREEAHENAERLLLSALDEVDATSQRRSWWPAWRSNRMNTYVKLIGAAAAVLLVAVVGYQSLPANPAGGTGGQPTLAPSPSPTTAFGGVVQYHVDGNAATTDIDAVTDGASVSGTAVTKLGTGTHTVRLACAARDGDAWVVAGTTEKTTVAGERPGAWSAVIVKDGSPQQIAIWLSEDASAASDCGAFVASFDAAGLDTDVFEAVESGALVPPADPAP